MKAISKIVCCVLALAWFQVAAAEEDAPKPPPSHGGPVKAHPVKKMDRMQVEKRLADRANRTLKRNDQARRGAELQAQAGPR